MHFNWALSRSNIARSWYVEQKPIGRWSRGKQRIIRVVMRFISDVSWKLAEAEGLYMDRHTRYRPKTGEQAEGCAGMQYQSTSR